MFIFSFIRGVVDGIMSAINAQFRLIADTITAPLRQIVQQVVGGAWRGDGATRFVTEMTSEVIPMLVNIANVGFNFNSILRKATEIINGADRKATQQAQQLYDIFNGIFR